jgi:hypothetical protein
MRVKNMANKSGKDPNAVALGNKGGKVGGPARAKVLTASERSRIARMGARAKNKKK